MPPVHNPKVLARRSAEDMQSVKQEVAGLRGMMEEVLEAQRRILHVIESNPELARSLGEESGPATSPRKSARRKGGLLGGLGRPDDDTPDDDTPDDSTD